MSTNILQSLKHVCLQILCPFLDVSVICLFGYKLLQFAKDNNKSNFLKN